jgi:hypothetical protein
VHLEFRHEIGFESFGAFDEVNCIAIEVELAHLVSNRLINLHHGYNHKETYLFPRHRRRDRDSVEHFTISEPSWHSTGSTYDTVLVVDKIIKQVVIFTTLCYKGLRSLVHHL